MADSEKSRGVYVEAVNNGSQQPQQQSRIVSGAEKCIALDTAALLGGKEYLIAQILEDSAGLVYTEGEKACLEWALNTLWSPHLTHEQIRNLFVSSSAAQSSNPSSSFVVNSPIDFTNLLTEFNARRLTRILSTTLLYCGRYEDTVVYQNPVDDRQRILQVNLDHFPYIELPFAHLKTHHTNRTSSMIPCRKLAIVYFKLNPIPMQAGTNNSEAGRVIMSPSPSTNVDSENETGPSTPPKPAMTAAMTQRGAIIRPRRSRNIILRTSFCANPASVASSPLFDEAGSAMTGSCDNNYRRIGHGLALERDMLSKIYVLAAVPVP